MVYVDPLVNYGVEDAPACFRCKPSCHMYADTLDELHAAAAYIGLKRSWFQNAQTLPHYDLTPSKRKLAVKAGVQETDHAHMVAYMRARRKAL